MVLTAFQVKENPNSPLEAIDRLPKQGASTNHGFSGTADIQHIAATPRSCFFGGAARTPTCRSYANIFLVTLEGEFVSAPLPWYFSTKSYVTKYYIDFTPKKKKVTYWVQSWSHVLGARSYPWV